LNIKYIINVSHELSNHFESYCDFTYYNIRIKDNGLDSLLPFLDDSYDAIEKFLENNDGNILVHCYMGSSRSASVIANYIAKKEGKSIEDVINELKKIRTSINPSVNFVSELSMSSPRDSPKIMHLEVPNDIIT